ncbi:MAG: DinB family protein [Crocinitomicaceae bacterium]
MTKNDIKVAPEYYHKYIQLAGDGDLMAELMQGGLELYVNAADKLEALGQKTYAEGKWTVQQMLEHLMDTERLFQARALRFARNDKTEIPGYDEDFYATNARSNEIPLRKLLSDYRLLRSASIAMFSNFNAEELMRTGVANGQEISVLAMGFIMIGHPIHHFNVLEERYFGLI